MSGLFYNEMLCDQMKTHNSAYLPYFHIGFGAAFKPSLKTLICCVHFPVAKFLMKCFNSGPLLPRVSIPAVLVVLLLSGKPSTVFWQTQNFPNWSQTLQTDPSFFGLTFRRPSSTLISSCWAGLILTLCYHLVVPSSLLECAMMDPPNLIHNCLGHPSVSKLLKIVPHLSTLHFFRVRRGM